MSDVPPAHTVIEPSSANASQLQTKTGDAQMTFKVFKPSNAASVTTPTTLPDDYFTPTAADLKAAQSTLSARTQALVNAPLQLRAVKEANEKAKRDRWPNTTIRVKFTDRTMLEKTFLSTEKIRSVYAFVRSCLRDDVKPIKFILYQSPPKRDLKVSDSNVRDLSLSELQLAPSSILLLRFEDDALNGSDFPAPLITSVSSQAVDLPPPSNYDLPNKPSQQISPPTSSAPENKTGEKKIPKWLKMGLKK